ncbi:MAG TPA: hypothetical protein VGN16_15315, partial [Acidobacteriaceae bacterium]
EAPVVIVSVEPEPAANHHSGPMRELVPVPASVFDDEFFTQPKEELRAREFGWAGEPNADHRTPVHEEMVSRQAIYPSAAAEPAHAPDELDIPAFLRRSR